MFDKEKFHNQLALRLGYERIVSEKRFFLHIDDNYNAKDPWITIEFPGHQLKIGFNASDEPSKDVWGNRINNEQLSTIEALGLKACIDEIIETIIWCT